MGLIEKTKDHIKVHKEIYITGTVCTIIAGITFVIMRGRHADLQSKSDGPAMVTVRPFSLFSNKQITNVVTVVEREGRGHPGYIIRCLETKELYLSQRDVAIAMKSYPSVVSNHLTGKIPDIHGLHFERIGHID